EHAHQAPLEPGTERPRFTSAHVALGHHHGADAERFSREQRREGLLRRVAWEETHIELQLSEASARAQEHTPERELFDDRAGKQGNEVYGRARAAPLVVGSAAPAPERGDGMGVGMRLEGRDAREMIWTVLRP